MLGEGFEQVSIPLGPDPDGEAGGGTSKGVCATLVRHKPEGISDEDFFQRSALLYVPGLSDYFFQKHEAEFFTANGYAFYAIDLRKCGRSHREGQSWHYVSDLALYNTELTSAASIIAGKHSSIIPMGHST